MFKLPQGIPARDVKMMLMPCTYCGGPHGKINFLVGNLVVAKVNYNSPNHALELHQQFMALGGQRQSDFLDQVWPLYEQQGDDQSQAEAESFIILMGFGIDMFGSDLAAFVDLGGEYFPSAFDPDDAEDADDE
jgi:hypothetical protein